MGYFWCYCSRRILEKKYVHIRKCSKLAIIFFFLEQFVLLAFLFSIKRSFTKKSFHFYQELNYEVLGIEHLWYRSWHNVDIWTRPNMPFLWGNLHPTSSITSRQMVLYLAPNSPITLPGIPCGNPYIMVPCPRHRVPFFPPSLILLNMYWLTVNHFHMCARCDNTCTPIKNRTQGTSYHFQSIVAGAHRQQ